MKKTTVIFCLLIAALISSCTQNGGRIGPLFGSWYLESATCDGEPFALPTDGNTYWIFQGKVLVVKFDKEMYESQEHIATWEYATGNDHTLLLDFTHSDDNTAAGHDRYSAPAWMGFVQGEILAVEIEHISGSDMTLEWASPSGEHYRYRFTKTW